MTRNPLAALGGAAAIGTLGGLIGLAGAMLGGRLLGLVPNGVLLPLLALLLVASAVNVWRHAA